MELKNLDTGKLLFDPKKPTFVRDISKSIPEFSKYNGKLPKDKLFAYIVIMYDMNSSLGFEIINYYDRKREVADMLEFRKNKEGNWIKSVEDLLLGVDEESNLLIGTYIAQFGRPEYVQFIAYNEMLKNETKKVLDQKGNKDTIANIEKITSRLKELTRELFQSGQTDEVALARKALYAKAERDRIRIRPEEIVKIIEKDGVLPKEFNQYGDGDIDLKSIVLKFYNESVDEKDERKEREANETK